MNEDYEYNYVWICNDCAKEMNAKKAIRISTYHTGACDFCKQTKTVTETRDWGYPGFKKKNDKG